MMWNRSQCVGLAVTHTHTHTHLCTFFFWAVAKKGGGVFRITARKEKCRLHAKVSVGHVFRFERELHE